MSLQEAVGSIVPPQLLQMGREPAQPPRKQPQGHIGSLTPMSGENLGKTGLALEHLQQIGW